MGSVTAKHPLRGVNSDVPGQRQELSECLSQRIHGIERKGKAGKGKDRSCGADGDRHCQNPRRREARIEHGQGRHACQKKEHAADPGHEAALNAPAFPACEPGQISSLRPSSQSFGQ